MPGTLTCADCGKPMMAGAGSKPQGEARCHPCRRLSPTVRKATCDQCGATFARKKPGRFCSSDCYGLSIRTRPDNEPQILRRHREGAAPGLSTKRRSKLLAKWMRQQKSCAYCDKPADTVDHVVPLVRGGTNYEGNLVPACRRCNSSKSGRMVVEWRTGRVLPKAIGNPNWQPKPKPAAQIKPQRQPHACPMCQQPTLRNKYCSTECATERERRYVRDKYRARSGLTVDPLRPTSKWAA